MSASTISAGKAFLQLLIDNTEFRKGLDGGLKHLKAFSASALKVGAEMAGVGAAITAPFIASLKVFTDVGGELADMTSRTGLSVQSLTELKYAATLTGTSLQAVEKAAREMQTKGLDPNRIFEYAEEIAAIEDPVKRAQAAFDLWGKKAGAALLPMLSQLPQLRKRAHELGLTWNDDMLEKADRLGDIMDTLKLQLGAMASAIATAVAPQVSRFLELISNNLGPTIEWIQRNGELVAAVAALGVALGATGTAIAAIAGSVTVLVPLFVALGSPIGLAALAITAFGGAIIGVLAHTGAFHSAIDFIGERMSRLSNRLQSSLNTFRQLQGLADDFKYNLTSPPEPTEAEKKAGRDKELKGRIAENRRRFGNPFGIGPDRTPRMTLRPGDDRTLGMLGSFSTGVLGLFPSLLQSRLHPLPPRNLGNLGVGGFPGWNGPLLNPAFAALVGMAAPLKAQLQKSIESFESSMSRPLRGGTGGAFAEQIGGATASQAREERMLKLEDQQVKILNLIEGHLRNAGPLIFGNT